MKDLLRRARATTRDLWQFLVSDIENLGGNDATLEAHARFVWSTVFAPLNLVTAGADILELVPEGESLANYLLTGLIGDGPARTAIGTLGAPIARQDPSHRHLNAHETPRSPVRPWRDFSELEPRSYDLILARDYYKVVPFDDLETTLSRLYDLCRPGGTVVITADCFGSTPGHHDGYGLIPPTMWSVLALRAGFEIGDQLRLPEDPSARLFEAPENAKDSDGLSCRVILLLLRPWESSELQSVWRK